MFNHSKDFYQMNAGAHRRRASNLRAPALTWHRAFWIDPPSSYQYPNLSVEDLEAKRKQERDALKDRIDGFIFEFREFLLKRAKVAQHCEIHPFVSGKAFLFNKAVTVDELEPIAGDALSEIEKDVLYSDNRVVVMEFDWEGIAVNVRMEMHTEYFTVTTLAEIGAVYPEREEYKALVDYLDRADGRIDDQERRKIVAALNEFFFDEFWQNQMKRIGVDQDVRDILEDQRFNTLFADFRGMIISDQTHGLRGKIDFGKALSWGKQIDFKLLPLFSEIERYECTASYMLDGRALYLTTLGPQLPDANAKDLLPLQYVVYVHQSDHQEEQRAVVSKWQLGRLIDRIHLLGTVRLASLKHLPQLRDASTSLSGLDGHFKKARVDLTGGISSPDLQAAHVYFANITTEFNKNTATDTGMLYRIERSRYYQAQFNDNVGALRIRRLEGFQRYDEFVRHRLGPVFDFIDRLGVRYERAVNTLSLFDQYNLSIQSHQIAEQSRHIAAGSQKIAAGSQQIATRSEAIDEDIRKIQVYGEFALLGALLPYYLTNLAEHFLKPKAVVVVAGIILVVFWGLLGWRIGEFRDRKCAGIVVHIIGGLVAAAALIGIFCALDILKSGEAAADQLAADGTATVRWGPVDLASIKYLLPERLAQPLVLSRTEPMPWEERTTAGGAGKTAGAMVPVPQTRDAKPPPRQTNAPRRRRGRHHRR